MDERETDLYFKNAETGEFKLAKRKEDSLALSILKLNGEREEIKQDIDMVKSSIAAQLSMFETLLRSELKNVIDKMCSTKEQTSINIDTMRRELKTYAETVVVKQREINSSFLTRVSKLEKTTQDLEQKILDLSNVPMKAKAKYWDFVIISVASGIVGMIVSNLSDITAALGKFFIGG